MKAAMSGAVPFLSPHRLHMAPYIAANWFQSLRGTVLCHRHVLELTVQQWVDEGWAPVPSDATPPVNAYQCRRCVPL